MKLSKMIRTQTEREQVLKAMREFYQAEVKGRAESLKQLASPESVAMCKEVDAGIFRTCKRLIKRLEMGAI